MSAGKQRQRRFHSEAQRRKLQELVQDGKISQADYARMEHNTPKGKRLPERKP